MGEVGLVGQVACRVISATVDPKNYSKTVDGCLGKNASGDQVSINEADAHEEIPTGPSREQKAAENNSMLGRIAQFLFGNNSLGGKAADGLQKRHY
ncbi:MAG: hypothetical protein ABIH22_02030 [Candidatus Margulisiibacteriota bacterium]